MALTMAAGSFVAGASSEGGGAVAFPVMTLLFHIPPETARNFSLAIQSVGMSAAAYVIIRRRVPVEWRYLGWAAIGGAFGMVLGTLYVVPHVSPAYAKMLFVSFWLSFACVLFFVNEFRWRAVRSELSELTPFDRALLVVVGMLGGVLSAIVGSGIDILTFSFVTLRYRLSEKVATPTSVILMASNSLVGLGLHGLILRDFGAAETAYWIACIPVVVIGAPLGAQVIASWSRRLIARFLCAVIVVQFLGACWVIKPSGSLAWFALGVFVGGIALYAGFATRRNRTARAGDSLAAPSQPTEQTVAATTP
jgi:uncharacterized membrane protein YfcA